MGKLFKSAWRKLADASLVDWIVREVGIYRQDAGILVLILGTVTAFWDWSWQHWVNSPLPIQAMYLVVLVLMVFWVISTLIVWIDRGYVNPPLEVTIDNLRWGAKVNPAEGEYAAFAAAPRFFNMESEKVLLDVWLEIPRKGGKAGLVVEHQRIDSLGEDFFKVYDPDAIARAPIKVKAKNRHPKHDDEIQWFTFYARWKVINKEYGGWSKLDWPNATLNIRDNLSGRTKSVLFSAAILTPGGV